jgi:3-oxoadipate enol-lactonase
VSSGFITADDGCRIAYNWHERQGAPVLVLSPSLGTAMALFDPQLAAFGERYSVLCYDPRGHGASDVPAGAYSLDRLGRDVIELLDALGIWQAHFLGVSLGGMTGQWLGYRAPERIASLILANTSSYMGPPSGWADRISTVMANGMAAMVDPVLERWFTPAFRAAGNPEVARIGRMLETTAAAGYAGCSAAIRDMDLRPTAPQIVAPTLIIAGLQDPATPPEHARYLAGVIPGAQLTELDAAHLSNIECAAAFNREVLAFLDAA